MRIAFVSDSAYPWSVGGMEAFEYTEARELAKEHDVHYFSLRWPGMRQNFKKEGINYHTSHRVSMQKFYRHGRRSIREAIIFSINLLSIFNYKFDFIEANEFPVLHLPILILYCKLRNCKLILDVAEVWDKNYWVSYLGDFLGTLANSYASTVIRYGDAYIVNSSVTADRLHALEVEKHRIHRFAPLLDDKELSKVRKVSSPKMIMFDGRLIKEKRLDKWLLAVKEVASKVKDVKALIVGEGPEKQNITNVIEKLELNKIVEFRPFYRDRVDLYKRLKEATLFLQMSDREGLSRIILESLAVGTPVVLPDYSPVPEEVKKMCIVENEKKIPKVVAEILNSKDKGKYIKNEDEIDSYLISNVNKFYNNLFRNLEKK